MKPLLVLCALLAATPAFAKPVKKPVCTAAEIEKYKSEGVSHLSNGEDVAALVSFEKAYTCKADATLLPRMVLASCKSSNTKKAKLYYDKCGKACATLVMRCKTYNITLE